MRSPNARSLARCARRSRRSRSRSAFTSAMSFPATRWARCKKTCCASSIRRRKADSKQACASRRSDCRSLITNSSIDPMKVCIFGAGAIGGYLGVGLANAGIDVSLVARGTHLAAMRKDGLRLQIDGEERVARVRCTDNAAELGPQDFVIIALKAHSIPDAVDS